MLYLSGDDDADKFLSEDPLALLIGMVLDQQVPLERAFSSPRDLRDRLGGKLDAGAIAAMAPAKLGAAFSERPALHRFPISNAERVQQLCRIIVDEYGGDAAAVWTGAKTGAELFRRVRALPGFGDQKAKIFVALLGKQLGVKPSGWQAASKPFGDPGTTYSVADITGPGSLHAVRAYKAQLKAAAKAKAAAAAGG
ncbi:MAG TPA: HhH-GPD-type base excision DNA repair protein [Acidimicrobiales bacterium]|nr:HhH-GPD-type base excision DNA repair protein [Acidimicrobiales bacterium]